MTSASSGTVVIQAASREGLLASFASRSKHLTWTQIRKRFDDLLRHGYADARCEANGKWAFVLMGRRTSRREAVS
jgi:hypothetical protein